MTNFLRKFNSVCIILSIQSTLYVYTRDIFALQSKHRVFFETLDYVLQILEIVSKVQRFYKKSMAGLKGDQRFFLKASGLEGS